MCFFEFLSGHDWYWHGALFASYEGACAPKVESHIKLIRGASLNAIACLKRMLTSDPRKRWTAQQLLERDAFMLAHAQSASAKRADAARAANLKEIKLQGRRALTQQAQVNRIGAARQVHHSVQPALKIEPRALANATQHRQAHETTGRGAPTGALHRPPPSVMY